MASTTLMVKVQEITHETPSIVRIKLVDKQGRELPVVTAGSHIDIYLENDLIRQYSLSSDPCQRKHYEIAVLREPNGRGGSEYIHRKIKEGSELKISTPRNNFPLVHVAERHIFLAGGIGITPMMSMMAELDSQKANYLAHYCTCSVIETAFYNRLKQHERAGRLVFHHDGGNPKNSFDISGFLFEPQHKTHVYVCGPPGFMKAAELATEHWPAGSVHSEYFIPSDGTQQSTFSTQDFQVKINSTGDVFTIPKNQSIVEVLRDNGFSVDTSCEDGFCGTCMTRFLDGQPEHHDMVLDDEDREEFVLICCARSKTPCLVLDL